MIPIGLCIVNHESLEIGYWKPMLQHHFIKFCPHKSLNFGVLKLHIINSFGWHFTIDKIIHMISHNCPNSNMFHMIKHDPSILQIPCRLHSCEKVDSTPISIYQHLENEHLLSTNLSWEVALLDVVISTLGLQLKYVINMATCWMTLEKNNKVSNVGRAKFTILVLDVF
jgi:hypothetical protein